MKEMLPFYGVGLLAIAMAITTQGQAVIDGKGVEKGQPQTERSQPSQLSQLITQPLKPNPQPVLSKSQSDSSPFAGMSDQAIVNQIATDLGVKHPPTVVHACSYNGQSGFRGLSVYAENRLVICLSSHATASDQEFTIAHEVGHFLQYQQNPDAVNGRHRGRELVADRTAIDYFNRIGYLAPIATKSRDRNGGEYAVGTKYAKQVLTAKGSK